MAHTSKQLLKKVNKSKTLILMVLPAILICFLFSYLPMAGVVLAFKNYNYRDGIFSPWVGFNNFRFFFVSGKALEVSLNTILYNLLFLVTGTTSQILVAILVAEMSGKYYKKICQSFMFIPFFISWVVVSAFMYNIFNYDTGVANGILRQFQLEPVNIYSKPGYWYFILPILFVWKNVGYGSVLYLAAIVGFDVEYYEAATVDGANRFQKIFKITIPLLVPTIVILTLLSLGRILKGDFDMFYNIIGQNGLLYKTTDIIDTFVFRSIVQVSDIGMTAAVSFYQSALCLIIIVATNALVKKYHSEYALF
jgi:putative aldouronate transport system permease protein